MHSHELKQSLFVETREWCDDSGNAYYSARVSLNGHHIFTTGFSYGYGDHYKQDVAERLIDLKILPIEMAGRTLSFAREHGFHVYTVKYASKKRDLFPEEEYDHDTTKESK